MSLALSALKHFRRLTAATTVVLLLLLAQFTPAIASDPAVELTVTSVQGSSASLSWTATGVSQVYSYDVCLGTLGFSVWRGLGAATSWTYTRLSPSRKYTFQVRANTPVGEVLSNAVVVEPGVKSPPAPPSALTTVVAGPGQVDLTWEDNSSDEKAFRLERATSAGGPFTPVATLRAGVKSFSDCGLAEPAAYYYRVCASNSVGSSSYSNTAVAFLGMPPGAPTNLAANPVSSSRIDIQWSDNSFNEDGFKIERSLSSTGPFVQINTLGPNQTAYSVTGLSAQTTYYFRVRAYNSAGSSTYSNKASATTYAVPPQAPSGLEATAVSSSTIELHWQDNSTNETGFAVECSSGDAGPYTQIAELGTGATSYSDTDLAASSTWYYRVCGFNSAGSSAYAGPVGAATQSDQTAVNPKLVGFISDVGAVQDVVVVGDVAYLASNPFGLVAVDISDPYNPFVFGSQHPLGPATHIAVSGSLMIAVAAGTPRGTDIIDISNPLYPEVASSIPGTSVDAAISGTTAYVVSAGDVKVIDVSTPNQPQLVTTLVTPNIASGIAISGNIAVVSDCLYGNIRVVDISNPRAPSIVGSASLGGLSGKVAISGNVALVANTSLGKLQLVNISVPSNPQPLGSISTGSALDVTAVGNLAYVSANGSGLAIVDISNPAAPRLLSNSGVTARACAVSGGVAILAQDSLGIQFLDVTVPTTPSQIRSFASSSAGGHLTASGNVAMVTGSSRGTDILDITNPYFPRVISSIPDTSVDAAISGTVAYVVAKGDVKVVDITNPAAPQLVTTLVTPGIASGIAISGDIAVVSDCLSGNIRVVNIANRYNPAIVGSASLGGLSGKVAISGNLALIANTSLGKLQIVDISVPSSPTLVGSISTGSALDVTASGSIAYVSANGSGLAVIDISNPASPRLLANRLNSATACKVFGSTAFVAQGGAGMTLVDVSNPAAPVALDNHATAGNCNDVVVLPGYAITADGTSLVGIFDLWQ